MYRPLLRQQPWTASGYVCRQCRHHIAEAQRQQARHASTSPHEVNDTEGQDWANNFNDIGASRPTKPLPKSRYPALDSDSISSDVVPEDNASREPRRQNTPRTRARQQRAKKLRAVYAAAANVLPELRSDKSHEAGFGGLKTSLEDRIGSEGGQERQSGQKTMGRRKELSKDPKWMVILDSQVGGKEQRPGRKVVRDDKREREPTVALSGGPEKNGAERQTFEDLMASLQTASGATTGAAGGRALDQGTEVVDDVDVPAGRVSDEDGSADLSVPEEPPQRIIAPQFSMFPGRKARNLPSSSAATLAAATKHSPLQRVRFANNESHDSEQPEDTILGADPTAHTLRPNEDPQPVVDTAINEKTFAFGRHPELPLSAKVQEAKDRQKWGSYPLPAAGGGKKITGASWDALRAADKVSPDAVVVTAGGTKAWGAEPVVPRTAKPVVVESARKDAAEEDRAAEKPQTNEGAISSVISSVTSGFNALRSKLGISVQRGDDAAESGHAPTESDAQISSAAIPKLKAKPGVTQEKRRKRALRLKEYKLQKARAASAEIALASTAVQEPGSAEVSQEIEVSDGTKEDGTLGDDASSRLANLHDLKQGEEDPDSHILHREGVPLIRNYPSISIQEPRPTTRLQYVAAEQKAVEDRQPRNLAEVMSSPGAAPLGEEVTTAPTPEPEALPEVEFSDIQTIVASELQVTPLNIEQPPVPPLQYGLDRALFNPGVYQLQDPHSRVYNFDPYLQNVLPIADFDFNALKEYKTSSEDTALSDIAKEHDKRYVGSTSSMTSTLAHFHYLLSNWRPLNLNMMSRSFPDQAKNFTNINRAPTAIFLRWKNGTYAIDADKEFDSPNVLMMLGKSMEKLLTLPREEYERHLKCNTVNPITPEEKDVPESYEYTTMGDFLMRSQLDAHDSRLPGTGMFDLKTRAVVPIRMDAANYEDMLGYEIHTLQGSFESYEREYYDMMRSTMLKYMLQARMGRMDGIFVAYHNIERIFGFQYLPIAEMDRAIHGQIDPCLGDQEFRASLKLLNEVLELATKKFPEQSLRVHVESSETPTNMMWIFAEPMTENEIDAIQNSGKAKVDEFEKEVMGIAIESPEHVSTATPADPVFIQHIETVPQAEEIHRPLFAATIICQNFLDGVPAETEGRVQSLKRGQNWEVQYILKETTLEPAARWARYEDLKQRRRVKFMFSSESEDGEEAPKRKKGGYVDMLQEMSERGREFRKKIDGLEAGSEKLVFGMPAAGKAVETAVATAEVAGVTGGADAVFTEQDVAATASGEVVEVGGDVDDYMRWLYQQQPSKA